MGVELRDGSVQPFDTALNKEPAVQRATTEGQYEASVQEGFELLGGLIANHHRALISIAREIDELRTGTGTP